MNTFYELWGVTTPEEAKRKIDGQKIPCDNPKNVKEQALSLVGEDIYKTLVEGYTEKQWGKSADKLPADIIKRLPLRFTFDNNYFNDKYQGIPEGGYTRLIENLLNGVEVRLNVDYLADRENLDKLADKILYTGAIDEFFGFAEGNLEYRSLRFETERLEKPDYQGNAVVNYTEREVPYTRIIEHKHFERGNESAFTVITREYPDDWKPGKERFYPVNDEANGARYEKYRKLAQNHKNVIFGGRLGLYKYYDMDDVVAEALAFADKYI